MHRFARMLGTLLVAAGVLALAWVVVVWRWEDPFTALYTHVQQTRLSHAYEKRAAAFKPHLSGDLAAVERPVAREAADYRRTLRDGDPVERLKIRRMGLNIIVVQGTGRETLKKGPGHYGGSGLPGEGRLVYVGGHRTTYLAPFAYIDDIRVDDVVRFELPYGAFTYRVTRHYVVGANDVSVLRNRGREVLRLQACHPRFFASHRYIVDAKLVGVAPRGGTAYSPVRSASS